ncbi:MAG TPA: bifunctional PIG-L family deacetylase/class I SAM-dependent methyltransferase [Pseudonocardiaceae bacterium]|jgi:LmbE family N-acetylglucosaminyl deacetylase|nr:bifunctional PIG-L family deacetylase/class I SAM-dependent methyltransferase [Pseudonocardiaceae bacterium]
MSERPTTPEHAWRDWLVEAAAEPFPDQHFRKVVVVAAHPDDETLGASGLVQHLHERDNPVTLVIATDGEAAFPDSDPAERAELGRRRRCELYESLHAQGLGAVAVHWLGLPDSGLAEQRERLAAALAEHLDGADLCVLPWPGDPHPDHQVVGETALRVAPVAAHRFAYPVWTWHWRGPDEPDLPKDHAVTHRLSTEQRRRKAAGIAAFASQLKPGPRGEEPILSTEMLGHFDRDTEVLFRQPPSAGAPISRFVELYESSADPWRVSDKWYERRKRAMVLACLPREHYGLAVEPACGIGVLTGALAARCDRVVAFDPAPNAVRRAREQTSHLSNVSVQTGALPQDLPPGPVDLLVFSEILYYLGDGQLRGTIDRAVAALRPEGHLLAVHWLPWAPEAPRDGERTHEILLAHPGLRVLVEHRDEQFVLHVLARR